jgi:hypothetical protein
MTIRLSFWNARIVPDTSLRPFTLRFDDGRLRRNVYSRTYGIAIPKSRDSLAGERLSDSES